MALAGARPRTHVAGGGGAPVPRRGGWPGPARCGRYERDRSPLDRGPDAARVIPYGRVPFVPAAALVTRRHLRFDATLRGGEDVEFVWRVPYVRYEPGSHVAHDHRTDPRAWLPAASTTAAPRRGSPSVTPARRARCTSRRGRPRCGRRSRSRRPAAAAAIAGVAIARTAREFDMPLADAAKLAGLGSLRSGRVVADALTRAWWPLSALALAHPRARLPLAAALATKTPLQLADDLAYGIGLWQGCLQQRTLDPLLPARPWTLAQRSLA